MKALLKKLNIIFLSFKWNFCLTWSITNWLSLLFASVKYEAYYILRKKWTERKALSLYKYKSSKIKYASSGEEYPGNDFGYWWARILLDFSIILD